MAASRKLSELDLEHYRAARHEIVSRVQYRDTALLAYTVALGGYGAFLFDTYKTNPSIPFVFESMLFGAAPLVSLFFTLVVLHHDYVIHLNAAYVRSQFPQEGLVGYNEWLARFHTWDRIARARKPGSKSRFGFSDLRFFGQLIPLSLPAAFTLAYAWKNRGAIAPGGETLIFTGVCLLDAAIFGTIISLHLWVRATRKSLATADLSGVAETETG